MENLHDLRQGVYVFQLSPKIGTTRDNKAPILLPHWACRNVRWRSVLIIQNTELEEPLVMLLCCFVFCDHVDQRCDSIMERPREKNTSLLTKKSTTKAFSKENDK